LGLSSGTHQIGANQGQNNVGDTHLLFAGDFFRYLPAADVQTYPRFDEINHQQADEYRNTGGNVEATPLITAAMIKGRIIIFKALRNKVPSQAT
jgi:hypothetical protein